jgi:hypothetical protein
VIEIWNEAQHGRFAPELWAADVRHPSVRCAVNFVGDDAVPPPEPEGLFPAPVAAALRETFELAGTDGGFAIYARSHD